MVVVLILIEYGSYCLSQTTISSLISLLVRRKKPPHAIYYSRPSRPCESRSAPMCISCVIAS